MTIFRIGRPDFWHISHNLDKVQTDPETLKTLKHGINCFKMLISIGSSLNASEFAYLIGGDYDMSNPKTAAVVNAFFSLSTKETIR